MKKNILCTICARSGSKGISNKALRKIKGIPLIGITIKQALLSKKFDEVVVSTDSKKIRKVAIKYGAKSWFLRPKKLSSGKVPKIPVIRHALKMSEIFFNKKYDICVDLDVTSPLRIIQDIKNSINFFVKNKKLKNLFSVTKSRRNPYFNMVEVKNSKVNYVKKHKHQINSRQQAPKVYDLNASIYIWQRSFLLKSNKLVSNKTGIFIMPESRSIDIDHKIDLVIVKSLFKSKYKNV